MDGPTGAGYYVYPASLETLRSDDPAAAKPIGFGGVATGGDTLSLRIEIGPYADPVDLYLGLYAPDPLQSEELFILTDDLEFLPFSVSGLVPWKSNVTGTDETLFGDVPTDVLPLGNYTLYLLALPAGSSAENLSDYHLWSTDFTVTGAEVVLAPEAIGIDDSTASFLTSVSPDGEFRFSGQPDAVTGLQPGAIVGMGVTGSTPGGALRRVVSVRTEGGATVVETEDAALEEAIEDGDIAAGQTFTADDIEKIIPYHVKVPYKQPEVRQVGDRIVYHFAGLLTETDENGKALDDIQVTGDIEFFLGFDFGLKFRWFTLKSARLIVTARESISIDVGSSVSFQGKKEFKVATLKFKRKWFTISGFPVLYQPVIDLMVIIEGSSSAGIHTGAEQEATARAGLTYLRDRDPKVATVKEFNASFDVLFPELTADADLKCSLGPKVTIYLYDCIGPYMGAYGFLEFDADIRDDPWWTIWGGIWLEAGIDFKKVSKKIPKVSIELPEIRFAWPILQADGPFCLDPGFSMNPSSLSGSADQQGAPVTRTSSIQGGCTGDSFLAEVAGGSPWLSCSVSRSSLTATMDPAGLAEDSYQGACRVSSSHGTAETVQVAFDVTCDGTFSMAPSALSGGAVEGETTKVTRQATVSQGCAGDTFTAGSDSPWLSCTMSGRTLSATMAPSGLTVGTYSGACAVSSSRGKGVAVPVTFAISPQACVDFSMNPAAISEEGFFGLGGTVTAQSSVVGGCAGDTYSAAASAGGAWLVCSMSGTTLTATMDPDAAGGGIFNGSCTVTSPRGRSSSVSITFAVSDYHCEMWFFMDPFELSGSAVEGSTTPVVKQSTVSEGCIGDTYAASSDSPWLSCAMDGETLFARMDPTGLDSHYNDDGVYSGVCHITCNERATSTDVGVTFSITSP